jgi:hypothetical protein
MPTFCYGFPAGERDEKGAREPGGPGLAAPADRAAADRTERLWADPRLEPGMRADLALDREVLRLALRRPRIRLAIRWTGAFPSVALTKALRP